MLGPIPAGEARGPALHPVRQCRDARDAKFLELAVNGKAGLIVTGDRDLLALNPFQGIPILTPTDSAPRPLSCLRARDVE